jgi:thymidylate synthase ThyX
VIYPVDDLTEAEALRVSPFVSNLDQPVFALVGLPETVKGAVFARYARYPGTLRRLLLDEFADDLPSGPTSSSATSEPLGSRADELYERVFIGYGDDSVAQLGGAHVACEYASNILTKVLERPRLAAYLEQSTRYIPFDGRLPDGRFRYYRDEQLGPAYEQAMDTLFHTYSKVLERTLEWVGERFPRLSGDSERAHRRALQAKALDLIRGLLPAASLSHVGVYASGQTYEQLILHLTAHPLPEARNYGALMLRAVQSVMPSFVARVAVPDRGGEWVEYLCQRETAGRRWSTRLGLDEPGVSGVSGPSVRLTRVDGTEEEMLGALLFEACGESEHKIRARVRGLEREERTRLLEDLVGERRNRRYRPGRGLESLRYRFEIVSDYGAFRDLQRHRLLTPQWQQLTADLGAEVPAELDEAGVGEDFRHGLDVSRQAYAELVDKGAGLAASYAVCLAFRMRYVLDLNAREAMHLIELRSGREGHPSYRAIAHRMHALIEEVHPSVAAMMSHVDTSTEPRLERMLAELRNESRRPARRDES